MLRQLERSTKKSFHLQGTALTERLRKSSPTNQRELEQMGADLWATFNHKQLRKVDPITANF